MLNVFVVFKEFVANNFNSVLSLVLALASVGGFFGLLFQNRKNRIINESRFILDAEDYFSRLEDIQRVYCALSGKDKGLNVADLKDEDVYAISIYLTFFETFLPLIARKQLKLKEIDAQFGYRFFIAVHDENVQKREIYCDYEYYGNLLGLYRKWVKYREKAHKNILKDENRLVTVRLCDKRDLDGIIAAQSCIFDNLADKSLFIGTELAVIKRYLNNPTRFFVVGLFVKETCCAYLFMVLTGKDDMSLNKYVNIGKKSKRKPRIASLDTVAVLPQYRGRKFQRLLIREGCGLAEKEGYDIVATCVSPQNEHSLNNMRSEGFIDQATVPMYGNERVILAKTLPNGGGTGIPGIKGRLTRLFPNILRRC